MTAVIRITIRKESVPSGTVLLEDAAALTAGLRDTLARLVQHRLGDVGRGKLPDKAKRLTPVVLFHVTEGSGVLACRPLEVPNTHGRSPAILAASELVEGIRHYSMSGQWPRTMPTVVRNRFGAAVSTVVHGGATVDVSVEEEGDASVCHIDGRIRDALQAPEMVALSEPVQLIGDIYDINIQNRTFRIDAITKRVTVPFDEEDLNKVDSLRWQKALVRGLPDDERLKSLSFILELRAAMADEEAGVVLPQELAQAESTQAYLATSTRLAELSRLSANWDSYSAQPPQPRIITAVLAFVRDVARVFIDYSLQLPTPFVVPTREGAVQCEWSVEQRELELEVLGTDEFRYLQAFPDGRTDEGRASRWDAVRLVKWVATGERP